MLSRAAIVEAALGVLDSEGLDAVTMRRVAEELGTGPASLYAHVEHKDDLVAAVLDRVISEVTLPGDPDPDRWQEQIKAVLRDGLAVFGRHRDISRAALGTIPTGEGALPVVDAIVGILLASGVSRQVAAWSADILALYLTATAYEQSLENAPERGQSDGLLPTSTPDAEMQSWFASLPADRFPHLTAMAGPLTAGGAEERFEFGLDLLVRGIASTAPSRGRRRR